MIIFYRIDEEHFLQLSEIVQNGKKLLSDSRRTCMHVEKATDWLPDYC